MQRMDNKTVGVSILCFNRSLRMPGAFDFVSKISPSRHKTSSRSKVLFSNLEGDASGVQFAADRRIINLSPLRGAVYGGGINQACLGTDASDKSADTNFWMLCLS